MVCRLRDRFTNETYELSELVLVDRHERKEVGWQEYQSIQRERLAAYTTDFDESGFARFFKRCAEIIRTSYCRQYEYQVQSSVVNALFDLAERDNAIFTIVFENYLHEGNVLNLGPWALAQKLIQVCGNERSYDILYSGD